MHAHNGWRALIFTWLLFAGNAFALLTPLTPPHEPHDNNFYVCYAYRFPHIKSCTFINKYRKLQYRGCIISTIPCEAIPRQKISCKNKNIHIEKDVYVNKRRVVEKDIHINEKMCFSPRLKLFSWFNNYPQALNGFYRCAYS